MRVLIIEDDEEIVEAIALAFQRRWLDIEVYSTHLGDKGVGMVETKAPDIVILDLGLPDSHGFTVLKNIRRFSEVPVIILTVMAEEADIVRGLEYGADDYVVKPFRQMEFLARVNSVIRRQGNTEYEDSIVCGVLHLDVTQGKVRYGEKMVNVTATEGQILYQLMKKAGHAVSAANLAKTVWGEGYSDNNNSLKVHIRRLRQKIEADPGNPELILTRAGEGYCLIKPV